MATPSPLDLDLAKCFQGEQQLISWDVAYNALCDPDTAANSGPLKEFLNAKANFDTLSRPWQPFPGPSPQEKSKFDSTTAPINVTPGQTQDYNLDDIKADSLWLSTEAGISEYEALRLVMQEWQSRPTVQLLSGLTEEEALSVQEAAGFSSLGASTFVSNASILANPSVLGVQSNTQIDSSDQRRLRILDIYHSSCVSILRISQLLMAWGCAKDLRAKTAYGRDYRVCKDWLEQIGQAIANTVALDACVGAVKAKLEVLDGGYSWDVSESIQEAAYIKWLNGQTAELVHILHITLIHADLVAKGYLPATTIEKWFSTVAEPGFFCDFPTKTAAQQPFIPLIQTLVSLVSIAVLKMDLVTDDIESERYTAWGPSVYVLDGGLVERITHCFLAATQMGPSPATPPAFAWAVLTWRLAVQATALNEKREHDLTDQIAADSNTSIAPESKLEESLLPLIRSGEDESTPFENLATACSNFGVLRLTAQLLSVAMAGFGTHVDRISRDRFRLLFLQLIRTGLFSGMLQYSPDLIVLAHIIMIGDRTSRSWTASDGARHADPIVSFCLEDSNILRPLLIEEAQLRYPYEMTPFLKFFSAITRGEKLSPDGTPNILNELTNVRSLMQRLPEGFEGFRLEHEEENADQVALTEPLPQFVTSVTPGFKSSFPSQRRLLASTRTAYHHSVVIEPNTQGHIVDAGSRPFVALWRHHHSSLEYLTYLLSTYASSSNTMEVATQQPASTENATEIIGLFSDLIHSSLQASAARGDGSICSPDVLLTLGIHDEGNDTVNLILAIFEEELLRLCQEPSNEASLDLLVNCTQFLQALIVVAPNRVWPWLARSRLLESEGQGGSLASILIGTEMVLGRYDFLIGCIRVFKTLVGDAVEASVSRKSASNALTRFNAPSVSESGISEKIMSTTLLTFARTLASIYEGSLAWKYNRVEDRLEINIGICEAFTTILLLAYSVDDSPKLSQKLTKLIAPTAEFITGLYLTKSENDLPTNPILASLLSGADLIKTSLLTSSVALWKRQTRSTLEFSETLVRVAILLKTPWTHLEQQLFKATPLLARLYATSEVWKSPVVLLLETLVTGAVRVANQEEDVKQENQAKRKTEQNEPPSLLGHLGSRTAKNFLHVLSQLDNPLKIVDIQKNVWSLLASVVTNKQQWFALYLLTGNTPRETMRSNPTSADGSRNKALLSRALDGLSHLVLEAESRSWPLYTAMLEFVSAAQNNWSWAMGDLRNRKDFIKQLLTFLDWMAKQRGPKTDPERVMRSYQNKFAALTAEMLAMYLHSARQVGDVTPLKDIVPSLTYLEATALELPSYNAALHSGLKTNLEKKYHGVTVASLKRTTLLPAVFGASFFYDLDFADNLLGFDSSWFGPRAGQGYQGEVAMANVNLSLVESQVQLLQGWRLLALELSHSVSQDERLVPILVRVVKKCMEANARSSLPEALFGQLMMARSDLAFALLKKLADAKTKAPEARQLLMPIWDAVRASTSDFDNVFSSDSVTYYRSLLRILYLSLQFHLEDGLANDSQGTTFRSSFRGTVPKSNNMQSYAQPISNLLMDVLSETIAKGFRSLATQLHDEPDTVTPSDFALLTALLQRITAIPDMKTWHAQAALLFANSNTLRYATSLFSWSDKLTIDNNGIADPVYGELSLLFILSLAQLDPVAESMAAEGVLSQLNTANLINYYRRPGGMGPFDSPSRLHSIWTRGLLPLCLQLLFTVGAPIASEISSFLNQFPEQLQRSSNALNSRHATKITLSTALETYSLAAISAILDGMRAAGPKLGIQGSDVLPLEWDKDNVKDDIEGWMARKGALRERVIIGSEGDDERVVQQLEAAGLCLGLGASA